MSKLFKIIVSVIALSLIYLWVSSVFQSCSNKSDKASDDISLEAELTEGEEIIDVSDEDFFEDVSGLESAEDLGQDNFEQLEKEMITNTPAENKSNTQPTSKSVGSSSSGSYLLISGNYLVESNATEMLKKLKKLGYSNAEIVIFDKSQFHTVIASRFESYNTALHSASNLKQKGVDCYVKKKSF
jgi:hypothetical protein